ncbi:MAG: hypothetical protein WC742_14270 [Gallionellaceae bacterium]|jgi:DNA-binding transcriptional regulator YiaG
MLTHAELKAKALANAEVRAEYERLNKEEFALLDEILAARAAAGLSQAQVAERMGGCPEFCVNGISLLLRHPVLELNSKPI